MSSEKSLTPQIRFKGFTEAWEQRKFSTLVTIERGGSPRPIDDFITNLPNGLNWVKIGDAPVMGRYITSTSEKIKPEGLSKTRQVFPGDLVLSNSMSFGRPYIMAIEGCIHDGWLLIRDTQKIFDSIYLCHMLGTSQMLNQYRMFAAGSTVNNLNINLVGNANVYFPILNEQERIGSILNNFDNLITLHQRKLDTLKKIKSALLEKMFPKDGSDIPEIRFAGFTEAWEQRKLKDLFSYGGSGGTPSSNNRDFYNGNIPFLNISDLKERNIRFTEKQITILGLRNSAAWIVPAGSISLAMYASVGKVGIICNDTATSQAFYNMVIQDLLVRNFLYTRLEKADICNEWEPYISTGTQRNLNAEKVKNFKIKIPSKNEMNQIGSIFKVLDSLITLHQRKLDALKKIKSALLEKMFV